MEFDDTATSVFFGYRDAQHYYQENSSIDFFSKVRVPLLCLSSWDDPITGPHVIRLAQQAAAKSDFCTVAVTTKGGHVAFLEANPNFSLCKRWASWKSSFADRVGIKFLASALDCTNN
ncbi:hypothetical protein Pelo_13278 [Pelomyxa schiedti]|nr:hypothetical protein Pelo_13278 [Pelomyxa schiedti]